MGATYAIGAIGVMGATGAIHCFGLHGQVRLLGASWFIAHRSVLVAVCSPLTRSLLEEVCGSRSPLVARCSLHSRSLDARGGLRNPCNFPVIVKYPCNADGVL